MFSTLPLLLFVLTDKGSLVRRRASDLKNQDQAQKEEQQNAPAQDDSQD